VKVAIVGAGNVGATLAYIERLGPSADVCLSLPAVVGREGVREVLPIVLNDEEQDKLTASASALKGIITELGY
jgi:malate/lactate dehydrogenase